jgi:hypothetical protein
MRKRRIKCGKPGFRSFPEAFLGQQVRPVQHGGISLEFSSLSPSDRGFRRRTAACAER